jgi:hypothetical protein
MRTLRPRLSYSLAAAAVAACLPGTAHASATGTDEMLNSLSMVPPVVIFVLDTSAAMSTPCNGAATGDSCFTEAKTAIQRITRHFDDAQYGVVGTRSTAPGNDSFLRIAPVGSSASEIASALASVSAGGTTRNLAEVLESVGEDYLRLSTVNNDRDDDGDGLTGDWNESPIAYACTDVHIVVLARSRPADDDQVTGLYAGASNGSANEVACTAAGAGSPDSQCFYDNVVAHLYNSDRSALSGVQRIVTHTIALGSQDTLSDALWTNAARNTVGDGIYDQANDNGEILGVMTGILADVVTGTYSRSAPILSADGAYMIYSFYELTGLNPLGQGHVRGYALDTDPASPTFGEVLYEGPSAYGGAVWDAGNLLVSRRVDASESNQDDRDGVLTRDIYTWEDGLTSLAALSTERNAGRIGLDYEFVRAVSANASVLSRYLDTTVSASAAPCAADQAYDLDRDCIVDGDDLQKLVDFARGLPEARFRYLDLTLNNAYPYAGTRGSWKLGDSPYSIPVVVSARDDRYAVDPTYRAFLDDLEGSEAPSIVLIAANDGMLHAFRLDDDAQTPTDDEAGEELWAWVPGYLLLRNHTEEWAGSLIDMMWYGRTFLFDGSPVVEDVWIDANADGRKSSDGSEWHRVVVVQQGMGGPVTLALDITDPTAPTFLWEQTNETDRTAMGMTTGRPVVMNVYDATVASRPHDRWVAMWGGGRAVGMTSSGGNDYWRSSEANLYMWNMGDDRNNTESVGFSDAGDNIGTAFPDLATHRASVGRNTTGAVTTAQVNYNDSASRLEYGYISAALAAVDVDSDGDGDVVYFPVTTAYRPQDEGGGGPSDAESPGSSWLYKAILRTSDPDDLTWCEFYDPKGGSTGSNGVGARPEVFYAATTAWLPGGGLGIYWGTGTPYDRSGTQRGYFFAMKDTAPLDCATRATPISCDGNAGYLPLDLGEGLTSEPTVFAGVVYFSTYIPNPDACELGTGRVYGVRFDDCTPGLDTDGDGDATTSDNPYVEESGYISGVSVTSYGTVMYGTGGGPDEGDAVSSLRVATDPFMGTANMAWMEVF